MPIDKLIHRNASNYVSALQQNEANPPRRETYGQRYVREHGVSATRQRIAHLDSEFHLALTAHDAHRAENLADEAANLCQALGETP